MSLETLNSDLNEIQLFQLPQTKTVLWDHRAIGCSFPLRLSVHQKPKVHIREKLFQAVSQLVESRKNEKVYCKLVGNVSTVGGCENAGICIQLNAFDEEHPHLASTSPSYISGLVLASRKTLVDTEWNVDYYSTDLQSICDACYTMKSLDLSKLIRLRIGCVFFGIHCDLKIEMVSLETSFKATLINEIPIHPTELSEFLCDSKQHLPFTGFVTMDSLKKLVFIAETEPQIENLPLVGIWVSGVNSVLHPIVWAACVRYVSSNLYKKKLCLPPLPFLLVLYTPEKRKPEFFDCICNEGSLWPTFKYYSGLASTTLPKIPIMNSKSLCIDLNQDDLPIEFETADKQIKRQKIMPNEYVVTNTDDAPQLSRMPYSLKFMDYNHLVPDLSVLSVKGSEENSAKGITASLKFPYEPVIQARTVFAPSHPHHVPTALKRVETRHDLFNALHTNRNVPYIENEENCRPFLQTCSTNCEQKDYKSINRQNIKFFPKAYIPRQPTMCREYLDCDTAKYADTRSDFLPQVVRYNEEDEDFQGEDLQTSMEFPDDGQQPLASPICFENQTQNAHLEHLEEELPLTVPKMFGLPREINGVLPKQPKVTRSISSRMQHKEIFKDIKTKAFARKSCLKKSLDLIKTNDEQPIMNTENVLLTTKTVPKSKVSLKPLKKTFSKVPVKCTGTRSSVSTSTRTSDLTADEIVQTETDVPVQTDPGSNSCLRDDQKSLNSNEELFKLIQVQNEMLLSVQNRLSQLLDNRPNMIEPVAAGSSTIQPRYVKENAQEKGLQSINEFSNVGASKISLNQDMNFSVVLQEAPPTSPEATIHIDIPDYPNSSASSDSDSESCWNPGQVSKSQKQIQQGQSEQTIFGEILENVNVFLLNQGLNVQNTSPVQPMNNTKTHKRHSRYRNNQMPNFNTQGQAKTPNGSIKRMVSVQQSCIFTAQYCEYENGRNDVSCVVNNIASKYLGKDVQKYTSTRQICLTKSPDQTFHAPYGMSDRNMSFSTKQYLEKYGLNGENKSQRQKRRSHTIAEEM